MSAKKRQNGAPSARHWEKPAQGRRSGQATSLRAKKSLGQHFLNAPGICRRICALLEPEPSDIILEIGPGRGALTAWLEEAPHSLLILLEKDRDLARERHLAAHDGTGAQARPLTILTDACTFAWQRLGQLPGLARSSDSAMPGHKLKIVGNLPYNVASRLIWDIVSQAPIRLAAFMVQKEVAQRLAASPGNGHYGMLSVWVQAFTRASLEFVVPPGMFRPPPKVDSAVVLLRPRPASQHPACPRALARLLQITFQKRRKQIGGIFRETRLPELLEALEKLGLDPQLRPEDLGVEDFCRLAESCSQSLTGVSVDPAN